MYKNIILPASILAGTIVGAGIFALPYTFYKSGLIPGLFYLTFFLCVFILINLMYADVIARTEGKHHFAGYAGIYLGKIGELISIFSSIIGMILILTIYLIISAKFIKIVAPDISIIYSVIIIWTLGSLGIFLNIKKLSLIEFITNGGIVAIVIITFLYGIRNLGNIVNAPLLDMNGLFLPYGIILFSLTGRVAIPAIIGYFTNNNQPVKMVIKPIIYGTLASAFLYLFFVIGILGISSVPSDDSISGLIGKIPNLILILLVGLLGLVSLWNTYIVIGRDIKKSLNYDLKLQNILAGAITIFTPLILYFSGLQNFIRLVELVGGIFIGLEGIFIVLMWLKTKNIDSKEKILTRVSPIISYLLILVFIGGIIYEIAR